jgi:hypothetical protein
VMLFGFLAAIAINANAYVLAWPTSRLAGAVRWRS